MSGFTPGPWRVGERVNPSGAGYKIVTDAPSPDGLNEHMTVRYASSLADAQLIAVAPDFFKFTKEVEVFLDIEHLLTEPARLKKANLLFHQARELLAKAEGQQP